MAGIWVRTKVTRGATRLKKSSTLRQKAKFHVGCALHITEDADAKSAPSHQIKHQMVLQHQHFCDSRHKVGQKKWPARAVKVSLDIKKNGHSLCTLASFAPPSVSLAAGMRHHWARTRHSKRTQRGSAFKMAQTGAHLLGQRR